MRICGNRRLTHGKVTYHSTARQRPNGTLLSGARQLLWRTSQAMRNWLASKSLIHSRRGQPHAWTHPSMREMSKTRVTRLSLIVTPLDLRLFLLSKMLLSHLKRGLKTRFKLTIRCSRMYMWWSLSDSVSSWSSSRTTLGPQLASTSWLPPT